MPLRDARALETFLGSSGLPVSWDSIVVQAASADVVFIGEMHGHNQGLAFASALFEDVIARKPHTAALSMEFFERDHQLALDDYIAGITTEETFRKAARRTKGNYPPEHHEMVESAKKYEAPVIAANAPRRYVSLARTKGYDHLRAFNERQREHFRIPESLDDGAYREKFYGFMAGMNHGNDTDEDKILPFYRSMSLWDETMADSIARAVSLGKAPIVHVVGQFHSDEQGGLVTRFQKMSPGARVLVITTIAVWSDELRDEEIDRADIVVYVGPRQE
ncbi:ChaN family lipoprotein [Planctomycetaceae bacterium AH-315-I19]|nr:ChaN family lipoprotein [Planctomycetaceae bacterium AH-315-I19]MBN4060321.1 ChaN family lipoprotein [Planctomycetaceae bacterium AH-315-I19]